MQVPRQERYASWEAARHRAAFLRQQDTRLRVYLVEFECGVVVNVEVKRPRGLAQRYQ